MSFPSYPSVKDAVEAYFQKDPSLQRKTKWKVDDRRVASLSALTWAEYRNLCTLKDHYIAAHGWEKKAGLRDRLEYAHYYGPRASAAAESSAYVRSLPRAGPRISADGLHVISTEPVPGSNAWETSDGGTTWSTPLETWKGAALDRLQAVDEDALADDFFEHMELARLHTSDPKAIYGRNGLSKIDALLASGAVRLVRMSWLMDWHEQKRPIVRRQEMPEDAFVSYAQWRGTKVAGHGHGQDNLKDAKPELDRVSVRVVSYPWLSVEHPDPDGFHLGQLVAPNRVANLKSVHFQDHHVFWDFMSLHQKPRTEDQDRLFKEALSCMDVWYAHERFQVTALTTVAPQAANQTPYTQRGWCTFEQSVYNLNAGAVASDKAVTTIPLTPSAFRELLKTKKFTNSADSSQVSALYDRLFPLIAGAYGTIDVPGSALTDASAGQLAEFFAESRRSVDTFELQCQQSDMTDCGVYVVLKSIMDTPDRQKLTRVAFSHSRKLCNLSCLFALALMDRRHQDAWGVGFPQLSKLVLTGTDHPSVPALAAVFHLLGPRNGQESMVDASWRFADQQHGMQILNDETTYTVSSRRDKDLSQEEVWAQMTPEERARGMDKQTVIEKGRRGVSLRYLWDQVPRVERADGCTYFGELDRHGNALGFGRIFSKDGSSGQRGFFLNGRLLKYPLSLHALQQLETAVFTDLRETKKITQEQHDMLVKAAKHVVIPDASDDTIYVPEDEYAKAKPKPEPAPSCCAVM